ncbi:ABC transporter ATP-binding protein [Lacticaseibacillus sp. N501-2]|uniref:ABC transporter ATP-binding protein n=1 Tax=Lacticaseibacillus salsurae TaxID=3367729 RepID=UPI0038B35EDB
MLEVQDLKVNYGAIQAVRGVDFNVQDGEIVTLIGANGAGKSTIVHTLSGMLKAASGSAKYDDHELTKMSAAHIVGAGVAQVPEGRRIFAGLSTMENLKMGAYLVPRNEQSDVLANVFDQFPVLKERKNQDAATLSGGEQQMLAMGRALMAQPKLLMLDEPSMGLSPIYIQKIFDIIKTINQQHVTILLIEQNALQALQIANRGYVIANGTVKLTGSGADLLADPEVQKAYLGG